ncbi:MAG: hypothetical protein ACLS9K_00185 [Lachnospira eligens]
MNNVVRGVTSDTLITERMKNAQDIDIHEIHVDTELMTSIQDIYEPDEDAFELMIAIVMQV